MDSILRYNYYIDNMKTDDIKRISKNQKKKIYIIFDW